MWWKHSSKGYSRTSKHTTRNPALERPQKCRLRVYIVVCVLVLQTPKDRDKELRTRHVTLVKIIHFHSAYSSIFPRVNRTDKTNKLMMLCWHCFGLEASFDLGSKALLIWVNKNTYQSLAVGVPFWIRFLAHGHRNYSIDSWTFRYSDCRWKMFYLKSVLSAQLNEISTKNDGWLSIINVLKEEGTWRDQAKLTKPLTNHESERQWLFFFTKYCFGFWMNGASIDLITLHSLMALASRRGKGQLPPRPQPKNPISWRILETKIRT